MPSEAQARGTRCGCRVFSRSKNSARRRSGDLTPRGSRRLRWTKTTSPGWTHYRLLCQVSDDRERKSLAVEAARRKWTAPEEARKLKLETGSLVRVSDAAKLCREDTATKSDLFTYAARDVRVVDGDTLAVTVLLPPHNEIDKKLRLRGLNCPEMDTTAGQAAKRFTQGLVGRATTIVLTTTKPDKYDRYLADVFLALPSAAPAKNGGDGADEWVFLNNALLQQGHAVRSDGSAPQDWMV